MYEFAPAKCAIAVLRGLTRRFPFVLQIKRTTKFEKIIDAYHGQLGVEPKTYTFWYQGEI